MMSSGTDALLKGHAGGRQLLAELTTALNRESLYCLLKATDSATAAPNDWPMIPAWSRSAAACRSAWRAGNVPSCPSTKLTSAGSLTMSLRFGPPGVSAFVSGNFGATAMKPAAATGCRYGVSACAPNPWTNTTTGYFPRRTGAPETSWLLLGVPAAGYSMIVGSVRDDFAGEVPLAGVGLLRSTNVIERRPTANGPAGPERAGRVVVAPTVVGVELAALLPELQLTTVPTSPIERIPASAARVGRALRSRCAAAMRGHGDSGRWWFAGDPLVV